MSDLAAEFDARFKGQDGFDSPARRTVEQGGVDDSRIVEFPKEWLRDNYSRGSQDRELASSMFFYCVQLLWEDSQSVKDKRQQQRAKIRNMSGLADELIAQADAWAKSAKAILAEFRKDKTIGEALRAKINKAGGPLPEHVQKVQMQARVHKDRKRTLANYGAPHIKPVKVISAEAKDLKTVPKQKQKRVHLDYAGHPNDIYRLQPSEHWELFIDESGQDEDFVTGGGGVIAGVLNDKSNPLPPQPSLHAATDLSAEEIAAGDALLDGLIHHPNAGVLVVPIRAYHSVSGWGGAVSSLIDLVLRLLPLHEAGRKSKVTVYIEAREPYSKEEHFIFLRDACRFALARDFPARAEKVSLEVRKMSKEHPYNAYPDLVSNTCFAKGEFAKERLKRTGWQRTCFLNFQSGEIGKVLDCFHSGARLPVALWDALLRESGAKENHSIVDALLDRFGEEARLTLSVWRGYLDNVITHLNSKAIDMRVLERQIDWLQRFQPEGARMPLRLHLGWLTAKLAAKNHRGGVLNVDEKVRFAELIDRLFDEDAPLTCWATLNVAVAMTNVFDFSSALEFVERYLAKVGIPAVVGKRYYAQLLSTQGQHLAFLGRNAEAASCFKSAISMFGTLSEGRMIVGESDQTRAYLLTAAMDEPAFSDDELRAIAGQYIAGNASASAEQLESVTQRLAKSTAKADKYHHHLLLRYILSGRVDERLRAAYCACAADWKTEYGHPWEMIEFYRAMLCEDKEQRVNHLKRALDLAAGGDLTLQVIATVILGALLAEGEADAATYVAKVESVIAQLPAFGPGRIAALREQVTGLQPGFVLAAKVLPFNFR